MSWPPIFPLSNLFLYLIRKLFSELLSQFQVTTTRQNGFCSFVCLLTSLFLSLFYEKKRNKGIRMARYNHDANHEKVTHPPPSPFHVGFVPLFLLLQPLCIVSWSTTCPPSLSFPLQCEIFARKVFRPGSTREAGASASVHRPFFSFNFWFLIFNFFQGQHCFLVDILETNKVLQS